MKKALLAGLCGLSLLLGCAAFANEANINVCGNGGYLHVRM